MDQTKLSFVAAVKRYGDAWAVDMPLPIGVEDSTHDRRDLNLMLLIMLGVLSRERS